MPLLVWGSVALDSVETPTARRDNVLGGSAVFFSYAASYFTSASGWWATWATTGPPSIRSCCGRATIDTRGLNVLAGEKTFRWSGKYQPNMNDRETLEVHLNVLGKFDPVMPEEYRQSRVRVSRPTARRPSSGKCSTRCPRPQLVVADTMDLWINIAARRTVGPVQADRWIGAQRRRGAAAHGRREPGPRRPCRAQDGTEVRRHQEG